MEGLGQEEEVFQEALSIEFCTGYREPKDLDDHKLLLGRFHPLLRHLRLRLPLLQKDQDVFGVNQADIRGMEHCNVRSAQVVNFSRLVGRLLAQTVSQELSVFLVPPNAHPAPLVSSQEPQLSLASSAQSDPYRLQIPHRVCLVLLEPSFPTLSDLRLVGRVLLVNSPIPRHARSVPIAPLGLFKTPDNNQAVNPVQLAGSILKLGKLLAKSVKLVSCVPLVQSRASLALSPHL